MGTIVAATAAVYTVTMFLAGFSKVDGWSRWRATVSDFMPQRPVEQLALLYGLPLAEVAVGVLLLADTGAGFIAAATLLVVLAVGVFQLVESHRGAECRCFGAFAGSRIGVALAYRNLLLAGGAFAGGAAAFTVGTRPLALKELALAAVLGVGAVLVLEFRQFASQLPQGRS